MAEIIDLVQVREWRHEKMPQFAANLDEDDNIVAFVRRQEGASSGKLDTHTYREDSPRSLSPATSVTPDPTGPVLARIVWFSAIAFCVGFWYVVALLLLSHV